MDRAKDESGSQRGQTEARSGGHGRSKRGSNQQVAPVLDEGRVVVDAEVAHRWKEFKACIGNRWPSELLHVRNQIQIAPEKCKCTPGATCTAGTGCENYEMRTECSAALCHETCRNVGGRRDPSMLPKVRVGKSSIDQVGLFVREDVNAGREINVYAGRVQTKEMMAAALKLRGDDAMRYHIELKGHDGPELLIDAYEYGNETRFMNSACKTNCQYQKWNDADGLPFIKVVAVQDLQAGDELTADYGWSDKTPCSCGDSNCIGVIGQRKRVRDERNGQEAQGLQKRGKAVKVSIAEQSVGGRQKDKKSKWRHMDWYSQRDHDASWQE